MVNSQTENYLRLLLLNVTGATPLLRKLIICLLGKWSNKSLDAYLKTFKILFETFKKRHILNTADYNKLLGIGTSVDVNEWDASLLCFVLLNCFSISEKFHALYSLVLKEANNDLDAFVLSNQSAIEKYKGNGISDEQYNIMFPANGISTEKDLWDMELITFILTNVCPDKVQENSKLEFRLILQKEIELKLSSLNLREFLKYHVETLKEVKSKGMLDDSQYKELFPISNTIPDMYKWDTHTLRIVVLHCTSSVSNATVDAIKTIRKVRNECLAHRKSAEMINSEYYSYSSQLKTAIETIISEENLPIKEELESVISDAMYGSIDLTATIEVLKEFYLKNLSENGVILYHLSDIQLNIAAGFQQMNNNHAEVLRRFDRLEQNMTTTAYSERSEIQCVDMIIVVKSTSEHGRKQAEDIVHTAVKEAGDNYTEQIRAALGVIREIVNKDGRTIVEIKKGSVILSIKCISLKGLHRLLQYVASEDIKLHLKQLSSALTDFVGESIHINVYMSESSVIHAFEDVVGIMSDYIDNTMSLRMTIQADTVEELQRMVDEFRGAPVKSQLQSLSAGLSTYIREDINVDVVVPTINAHVNTTATYTDTPPIYLEQTKQDMNSLSLHKKTHAIEEIDNFKGNTLNNDDWIEKTKDDAPWRDIGYFKSDRTDDSDTTDNGSGGGGSDIMDDMDGGTSEGTTSEATRTRAAMEHMQDKITKTMEQIAEEQSTKEANVNEYLQLAGEAGKIQLQRIKQVFEKKNQKSTASLSQLQKKLEKYHSDVKTYGKHNRAREKLNDMGQGLKGVVGNIKGAKETIVYKPREFAHLMKNKFGSVDNINSLISDDAPWRDIGYFKLDRRGFISLKDDIKAFKPQAPVPQINIAIVGPIQAGKSSFINTIDSAFKGYVDDKAVVLSGMDATTSVTSKYTKYKISEEDGQSTTAFRHFCLSDTRGIMHMNDKTYGLYSLNFNYLLKGHIREGYKFDTNQIIPQDSEFYRPQPKLQEQMHCICFVLNGNTVKSLSKTDFQTIAQFLQKIQKEQDLRYVVLLTHMDMVCPHVDKDTSNMYTSRKVEEIISFVAGKLDISLGSIVPIVNYSDQTETSASINVTAFLALRQLLRNGNAVIDNKLFFS